METMLPTEDGGKLHHHIMMLKFTRYHKTLYEPYEWPSQT